MRRIADLQAKTDVRDAAIIARAARSLPHALRSLQVAEEQVAELSMLCGFDDDVVGQITVTGFSASAWTPGGTRPAPALTRHQR
jgi:hypothetical protein